MAAESGPAGDWDCEYPVLVLRPGGLVDKFRCWNRRRCRTCSIVMRWDDEAWIRQGVEYWLAQGASLVFLTLTLAEPQPYKAVTEMWRVYKQALDRLVKGRPGYLGGLPFVRVFERQEKRYQRTGETAVHIHALIAGLQYRGDRLSGKPWRRNYLKAEQFGLDGAVVKKEDDLKELALKFGFGPMLDITQVQASPDNAWAAWDVGKYLGKYLAKFEEIAQWLPKGSQVIAGSRGRFNWAGPGVTRLAVRRERLEAVLGRREADRTDQAPAHPSEPPETAQEPPEPEQIQLPIPWPPPRTRRRF